MRSILARFRRPYIAGLPEQLMLMNSLGDGSTLTLDFTTGVLDPRLTFDRTSLGTYVGPDGYLYGADSSTSSQTIGSSGTKTFTLSATAGLNRRYGVGDTVIASSGANNMSGTVTSYDPSTQVLSFTASSSTGSGTFTSWIIGTRMARFDYDPTTLAPKGLLIEATATNLLQQSADWTVSPWSKPATITWDGTTYATAPDGTTSAKQITVTGGSSASIAQAVTTGTNRTISLWLRAGSLTSFSVGAFDSAGTTWGNNADSTCRIISGPGNAPVQQVGGLWSITGLLPTQWTRVQIFRSTTYTNLLAYPGSSSGTINGTAYAWGFQMEAGNGASSLIPTGSSQGTRNQDQIQMTDLASLGFNTSAGTMTINGTYNKDANSAAYPRSVRFMGSSVQSMAMITSGKTLFGNTPNTSGGSYFEASRTLASAGAFKFGWTLTTAVNPALASATVSLNGSSTSITPLGQGAIVNPTSLQFLYGAGAATDYPSMNISSVKYWPYATTAADLNVRTSL